RNFDVRQGVAGNDMVISAIISNGPGPAGLTKLNGGDLQFTGNNIYTGPTAVSVGNLLVDGSQTGSVVTVSTGAVLGGIGTTGAESILGGIVAPGEPAAAKGVLNTTTADLSNGTLNIQVSGYTTAGTDY